MLHQVGEHKRIYNDEQMTSSVSSLSGDPEQGLACSGDVDASAGDVSPSDASAGDVSPSEMNGSGGGGGGCMLRVAFEVAPYATPIACELLAGGSFVFLVKAGTQLATHAVKAPPAFRRVRIG
mmetsp:Transcript_37904/g.76011  ORF Transcript_37904/g.76011 Transcript_37904/m.76011 type:complete len:123 (+) Transcript_37904:201-569(+)